MLPLGLAALTGLPAAQAGPPGCEQRSERAMEEGIPISGRTNLFRVVEEKGLPLHTAPDAACSPPQPLALKAGEEVIAYVLLRGYTAVLWNPPGSSKPGVFWVRSSGLKSLGYGITTR